MASIASALKGALGNALGKGAGQAAAQTRDVLTKSNTGGQSKPAASSSPSDNYWKPSTSFADWAPTAEKRYDTVTDTSTDDYGRDITTTKQVERDPSIAQYITDENGAGNWLHNMRDDIFSGETYNHDGWWDRLNENSSYGAINPEDQWVRTNMPVNDIMANSVRPFDVSKDAYFVDADGTRLEDNVAAAPELMAAQGYIDNYWTYDENGNPIKFKNYLAQQAGIDLSDPETRQEKLDQIGYDELLKYGTGDMWEDIMNSRSAANWYDPMLLGDEFRNDAGMWDYDKYQDWLLDRLLEENPLSNDEVLALTGYDPLMIAMSTPYWVDTGAMGTWMDDFTNYAISLANGEDVAMPESVSKLQEDNPVLWQHLNDSMTSYSGEGDPTLDPYLYSMFTNYLLDESYGRSHEDGRHAGGWRPGIQGRAWQVLSPADSSDLSPEAYDVLDAIDFNTDYNPEFVRQEAVGNMTPDQMYAIQFRGYSPETQEALRAYLPTAAQIAGRGDYAYSSPYVYADAATAAESGSEGTQSGAQKLVQDVSQAWSDILRRGQSDTSILG